MAPTSPDRLALDHAATTTLRPQARAAMLDAWDRGLGNASGTHASARAAKNLLEEARERAAVVVGAARPLDVVFTAGGTESDNLAVIGAARAAGSGSVVVSSIEHKAVLEAARHLGPDHDLVEAAADANGVVTADAVAAVLPPDAVVVSVMAANNEVGTVQPIHEIAAAVRAADPGVAVHTDAVQAFVADPLDVSDLGVDLLSLSGHKFGGPQGVGLLVASPGIALEPVLRGGGQEAGRRPGTANVAGVVGMVAAMEATEADRGRFGRVAGAERDGFESTLARRVPTAKVTGQGAPRLPHISHVRFPGVRAETLLIHLDRRGIDASAGSACQSGAVEPSHVLVALGMPEDAAAECVRFSFGWDTEPGTGTRAAVIVADVVDEVTP